MVRAGGCFTYDCSSLGLAWRVGEYICSDRSLVLCVLVCRGACRRVLNLGLLLSWPGVACGRVFMLRPLPRPVCIVFWGCVQASLKPRTAPLVAGLGVWASIYAQTAPSSCVYRVLGVRAGESKTSDCSSRGRAWRVGEHSCSDCSLAPCVGAGDRALGTILTDLACAAVTWAWRRLCRGTCPRTLSNSARLGG